MQRKTDELLETVKSVGLNISKKKRFREEVILGTTTQTSFKIVRISKKVSDFKYLEARVRGAKRHV